MTDPTILAEQGQAQRAALDQPIKDASIVRADADIALARARDGLAAAQAEESQKAVGAEQAKQAQDALLAKVSALEEAIDQAQDAGRKLESAAKLRKNQRAEDDKRVIEMEQEAADLIAQAEAVIGVPAPAPVVGDPGAAPAPTEPPMPADPAPAVEPAAAPATETPTP